ncbi:MAG: 2'-5' RNA ligase family protein, partial [bacterium]
TYLPHVTLAQIGRSSEAAEAWRTGPASGLTGRFMADAFELLSSHPSRPHEPYRRIRTYASLAATQLESERRS